MFTPSPQTGFRQDFEHWKTNSAFAASNFISPYFYDRSATLLDYLPGNTLSIADDWQELEAMTEQFEQQAEQVRGDLEARGEIPLHLSKPYFQWHELRDQMLQHSRILFDYRGTRGNSALPFFRR